MIANILGALIPEGVEELAATANAHVGTARLQTEAVENTILTSIKDTSLHPSRAQGHCRISWIGS